MVAPPAVASDIFAIAVSLALPGIAWAVLFFLAWQRPAFSASLGLGRREFWLLLPGSLLASFAFLPIAPISNDVMAVSFAGAVFPLAVGLLTLERYAPPLRGSAGTLLVLLTVEFLVLLGVVLLAGAGALDSLAAALRVSPNAAEILLVTLVAGAITAGVFAGAEASGDPARRAVAAAFAMIGGVAVLTFAGSQAIPGVGIVETFPYFLVPPLLVGIVAVAAAPRMFPGAEAFAIPVSFLAAGWGVVLGADVLRQPPLYGTGAPGLYVIGGAGVLDLVYLSSFLGFLGAFATHRLAGRSLAPVGRRTTDGIPDPIRRLREAYGHGVDGSLGASLAASASAAREAAQQAQRLLGRPRAPDLRPWEGLPVPGWVVSDLANLESVGRSGTADPREAFRAWLTARSLVAVGRELGRRRFASVAERLAAFGIDLAILGGAGAALFALAVARTPGDLAAVLGGLALNTAIYAFVAAALLYFALLELWRGATVGKYLLGLRVRTRDLGPIDGVASMLRNAPLLPAMTLLGIGLALLVAAGLRGSAIAGASLLGLGTGTLALLGLAVAIVVGVGIAGIIGVLVMLLTAERQRLGDLWAETWVVRATPPAAPGPSRPPAAGARSA